MDKLPGESEFFADSNADTNEEVAGAMTHSTGRPVVESALKTGEQLSNEIVSKLSITLHKAVLEGLQSKNTHNQTQNYIPAEEHLVSERGLFLKNRSGKGVEEKSIQDLITAAPDTKKVHIGQTGRLDSVNEDGYIYEMFTREMVPERAVQADSISQEPAVTIEEVVVSSTKLDADKSSFEGGLVTLTNKVNGAKLCLNDLLPLGTTLIPSGFRAVSQYARETYLAAYGKAAFNRKKGRNSFVEYRNINTNEGLLVTLHEIAHSWQDVHHPQATDDHIEMCRIMDYVSDISYFQKSLDYFNLTKKFPDMLRSKIKDEFGIEGDDGIRNCISIFIASATPVLSRYGIEVIDGEVKNSDSSDTLVEMAKNYIWTERHAWSTALRLYRTCEQGGVVPVLGDKVDASSLTQKSLWSYQEELNRLKIKGLKDFTFEAEVPTN